MAKNNAKNAAEKEERGGLITRDYKTTLETREENELGIISSPWGSAENARLNHVG